MSNLIKRLSELKPRENGIVCRLTQDETYKNRLADMGITPGVFVTLTQIAPFGDPIKIELRGYALTLRKKDAKMIFVEVRDE